MCGDPKRPGYAWVAGVRYAIRNKDAPPRPPRHAGTPNRTRPSRMPVAHKMYLGPSKQRHSISGTGFAARDSCRGSLLKMGLQMPQKLACGKKGRIRDYARAGEEPDKLDVLTALLKNIYWNGFEHRATSYRSCRCRCVGSELPPALLLLRIHPTRWNQKCCRSVRFLEPSTFRDPSAA